MIAFKRKYGYDRTGRRYVRLDKLLKEGPSNKYERLYGPLDSEGRALASLLAKDGYLYTSMPPVPSYLYFNNEQDKMDLVQDFFLHVTKLASRFPETFVGVESLDQYPYGKNWVNSLYRTFARDHWVSAICRIQKPTNGKRPGEFSLSGNSSDIVRTDGNNEGEHGRETRISRISYELYLRDKSIQFPGRELEEQEEVEHKSRIVHQTIETLLKRLTKTESKIVQLYYLQDKDLKAITRELEISKNSASSHLSNARRKLESMMNLEMFKTRTWIGG